MCLVLFALAIFYQGIIELFLLADDLIMVAECDASEKLDNVLQNMCKV
ncbi:hypothetical protein [Photobacterium sp. OFAV2-7]|nr:hypothetical protein [Photobacterium sp. OFAV2-7]MCG7585178.1 hypothetical protein [Photobacterium sp. OFAV2-7]